MSKAASGMWRSTLRVGPWLTDALGIKATSTTAGTTGAPALQLIVCPGNPGLGQFYTVFLQELHSLFQGTADVWAISNLGHDPHNLSERRVWCLETQVQHKVALLKEHVMGPGKPPAVIVAHSIGAYMMLKAIKQLEEERAADTAQQIPRVVLLMPFLATDWSSPRQRMLQFLSRFAHPVGALVNVLHWLPSWLVDALISIAEPGAEPHTHQGIRALLNPNGVRNNLHLAQHEFRDLDCPVDWDLMRRLKERAVLVCAPDDIWFPMHHYFDAQAAVPGLEEYYNQELSHGFCCHTSQCRLVAQLVHLSVKKALHPSDISLQDQQLEVGNAAADVSVLLSDQQQEGGVGGAGKIGGVAAAPAGPDGLGAGGSGSSRDNKVVQRRQPQLAGAGA